MKGTFVLPGEKNNLGEKSNRGLAFVARNTPISPWGGQEKGVFSRAATGRKKKKPWAKKRKEGPLPY